MRSAGFHVPWRSLLSQRTGIVLLRVNRREGGVVRISHSNTNGPAMCRAARVCSEENLSLLFRLWLRRRRFALRLDRRRHQPELLAQVGFQFHDEVFVFFQECAGILASLADAFAAIAEPCAGFLDEIVRNAQVDEVAYLRDALAVQDVELSLAEWRGNFVLHYFHLGEI